jgi:hypothetical protein
MKPAAPPARIDIVSHWKRIGREVERVRRRELRHFNFEEQRATIDALLQMAHERATAIHKRAGEASATACQIRPINAIFEAAFEAHQFFHKKSWPDLLIFVQNLSPHSVVYLGIISLVARATTQGGRAHHEDRSPSQPPMVNG